MSEFLKKKFSENTTSKIIAGAGLIASTIYLVIRPDSWLAALLFIGNLFLNIINLHYPFIYEHGKETPILEIIQKSSNPAETFLSPYFIYGIYSAFPIAAAYGLLFKFFFPSEQFHPLCLPFVLLILFTVVYFSCNSTVRIYDLGIITPDFSTFFLLPTKQISIKFEDILDSRRSKKYLAITFQNGEVKIKQDDVKDFNRMVSVFDKKFQIYQKIMGDKKT